jgi:hypothetical protein
VAGLAVAALGFDVALLMNEKFLPSSWQKCVFAFALIVLVASVGAGVWCAINRLRDFRATTAVTRISNGVDASEDRILANDLGNFTWALLWWQIGTFSAGILATIVVIAALYGSKLA